METSPPTSSPVLRQFELLELLAGAGRAMTLAEVVAASGWPKPSVHRMLAQLEAGGLLAREPDGRAVRSTVVSTQEWLVEGEPDAPPRR